MNKEEKLYNLFMNLISTLSNEEIERLCESLIEYVRGYEE